MSENTEPDDDLNMMRSPAYRAAAEEELGTPECPTCGRTWPLKTGAGGRIVQETPHAPEDCPMAPE